MEKFLHDLRTYFVVYVAVKLLLSSIAMLATLGPAMRATRVDLTTVQSLVFSYIQTPRRSAPLAGLWASWVSSPLPLTLTGHDTRRSISDT
jgi:hypothetical protein